MPMIKTPPFNSPWNPFYPPARRIPAPPTPLLRPSDVTGSGYVGAVTAPTSSSASTLAAASAAVAGSIGPTGTSAAGNAAAPTLANDGGVAVANLNLPPALQRYGRLTPTLDDAVQQYMYGWNPASQALYDRFTASEMVVAKVRSRRLPDPAAMPADGIRLNQGGTMLIESMTQSGTYVVLDYRVPVGYYGFINFASNEYNGGGFLDGSGALIWSIQVNQWFYPGYGQIPYSLGSRYTGLWNIAGGLPLRANQYIQYLVAYDTTATPAITPGGYVICTIQGWIAPIRERHHGTK